MISRQANAAAAAPPSILPTYLSDRADEVELDGPGEGEVEDGGRHRQRQVQAPGRAGHQQLEGPVYGQEEEREEDQGKREERKRAVAPTHLESQPPTHHVLPCYISQVPTSRAVQSPPTSPGAQAEDELRGRDGERSFPLPHPHAVLRRAHRQAGGRSGSSQSVSQSLRQA